jgi:collagenase-like PrtC family protease
MKLTVAANYDPQLVPKLSPYPVSEVYGKFPVDIVGGGRPSYMGSPLSRRQLREYVSLLAEHGIAFNYLLNAACMGNREWTRSWQKRLTSLLGSLQAMGIAWLTVSTPYLLEMIKARFPHFRVKVGIFAQVDTPRRARFWEQLGADAITLESFSINRDLSRLRAIRRAVRCDLQLIANHPCLPNCPMQSYHQNGIAHGSDGSGTLFIDYCFLRCCNMRLDDPSLLIKAGWIRPEDVGRYEEMGFTTFKLLERGIPSEELLKRVRAYSERRFDGNLAELILPYGFGQAIKKRRFWAIRHFLKPWQINPMWLKSLLGLAKAEGMLFPLAEQSIQIDSAAIPPSFLDGFRDRDCAMLDCAECGYCERIAGRAVRVIPAFRDECLGRFSGLREAILDGRPWGL